MLINARLHDWNLLMGPIWPTSTGYLISWVTEKNLKLKKFRIETIPVWKCNLDLIPWKFSLVAILCSSIIY